MLDKPRYLNYVFANIAIAIVSLCSVIGLFVYIPALIINYQKTNELEFYRQTRSSRLADSVKMEMPEVSERDEQGYINFAKL